MLGSYKTFACLSKDNPATSMMLPTPVTWMMLTKFASVALACQTGKPGHDRCRAAETDGPERLIAVSKLSQNCLVGR